MYAVQADTISLGASAGSLVVAVTIDVSANEAAGAAIVATDASATAASVGAALGLAVTLSAAPAAVTSLVPFTTVEVDCALGSWCSAGIETPCDWGFWSETVNAESAAACTRCGQAESTTAVLGATSPAHCRCTMGFFMDAPNDRSEPLRWTCIDCEATSGDIECEGAGLFVEDIIVKEKFWRPHERSTVVKACPGVGVGCAGGTGLSDRCRFEAGAAYPPQREVGDNCRPARVELAISCSRACCLLARR